MFRFFVWFVIQVVHRLVPNKPQAAQERSAKETYAMPGVPAAAAEASRHAIHRARTLQAHGGSRSFKQDKFDLTMPGTRSQASLSTVAKQALPTVAAPVTVDINAN